MGTFIKLEVEVHYMKKLMRVIFILILPIFFLFLGFAINSYVAQYVYSQKIVAYYDSENEYRYTIKTKKYKNYSENEFYINFPNFRLKNTYRELGTVGIKFDSGEVSNFSYCSVFSFVDDADNDFLEVISWRNPWKKETVIGAYDYIDILVCENFTLPNIDNASIKKIFIMDTQSMSVCFEVSNQNKIRDFIRAYKDNKTYILEDISLEEGFYTVYVDYVEYPLFEQIATIEKNNNSEKTSITWISRQVEGNGATLTDSTGDR